MRRQACNDGFCMKMAFTFKDSGIVLFKFKFCLIYLIQKYAISVKQSLTQRNMDGSFPIVNLEEFFLQGKFIFGEIVHLIPERKMYSQDALKLLVAEVFFSLFFLSKGQTKVELENFLLTSKTNHFFRYFGYMHL